MAAVFIQHAERTVTGLEDYEVLVAHRYANWIPSGLG
jgi:hypothetical protein